MSQDAEGRLELPARHFGPRVSCAARRREYAAGRACAQQQSARLGPDTEPDGALVPDTAGGGLAGETLEGFHATRAGSILTGMAPPRGSDRPKPPPAPAPAPGSA
jgi:hypothetical protein